MEIEELGAAEAAGLVRLGGGNVEFRHPLVRSAVLANQTRRRERP